MDGVNAGVEEGGLNGSPSWAWEGKHRCEGCGTGYVLCARYVLQGLKCCAECAHPSRWEADPYTPAEMAEMRRAYSGLR